MPTSVIQVAVEMAPAPGRRRVVPVQDCRDVTNSDLVRHGTLGTVEVPSDGGVVRFDGAPLVMEPVTSVPTSRLHFW